LIGAHADHLGHGERGDSLAKAGEKGKVHAGADDNASGMAGIMELARTFSEMNKNRPGHLKRDVIFALWSGEELGVLGSSHFVKSGGVKGIEAYLNMDMIGRYHDRMMVQGVGSAPEWTALFERLAASTPLALSLQEDPYLPTDAMALYLGEIPVASFFTGAHAEYHSPRDIPATLNYPGLVQAIQLVGMTAEELVSSPKKLLTYKKVAGNQSPMRGRGFRLYLGTIPDYAQEGIKGVRISGTSKASPAEKAGLKQGDIIVELGSQKVQNLYDYVYCLQSMKANEPTTVRVLREGRMVELKITPTLKE
jgi:hypothetical protein